MNKTFISIAVAGLALSSSSAFAYDGSVRISDVPTFSSNEGGAFNVKVTAFNTPVMNKVVRDGNNEFLSFCIERNENIQFGTADVNITPAAVLGGIAGGNPDPISLATAWLYSSFRLGTLNAKVAAAGQGSWAQNNAGAAALQDAIWWLEDELGNNQGFGTALINTAKFHLGVDNAGAKADSGGAFGVAALNLYNGLGNSGAPNFLNQDMLVIVPEPSTYVAAALLLIPVITQARRMRRSA